MMIDFSMTVPPGRTTGSVISVSMSGSKQWTRMFRMYLFVPQKSLKIIVCSMNSTIVPQYGKKKPAKHNDSLNNAVNKIYINVN